MKVIYIAGPFRAANIWAIEQNIRLAETVALAVWRAGAVAICPHTNSRFFHGAALDRIWLDGYLEIVKRCDAVLLLPGYQQSEGTIAEAMLADRLGKPVLHAKHISDDPKALPPALLDIIRSI